MSWKGTSIMEQKRCFIDEFNRRKLSISELCEDFGISRPTAHKAIKRFNENGYSGLKERSRAPHNIPHKTSTDITNQLLKVRLKHKYWGAGKILGWLALHYPNKKFPAPSTVNDILKRNGFILEKRRRRKNSSTKPFLRPKEPNDVWATDYKGEFRTKNGVYVYPLTITDQYSRFLIDVKGHNTISLVKSKECFTRAFNKYGLPFMILSDNGTPFGAGQSLARLTRLNAWWISLGITPVRIQPGHPEQNGKHERMHKELKKYTTKPPAYNMQGQQRKFNSFIEEYNIERPHDGIKGKTPDSLYRPSTREMPGKTPLSQYPYNFEVRRVSKNSGIKWKDKWVGVSTVLAGQDIGFEEVDDGFWNVFYYHIKIGYFDERKLRIRDFKGRDKRNNV